MAYTTSQILGWAKTSQALAAIGESKKKFLTLNHVDEDLHIKLYLERSILQYEYDQNPSSDNLFMMGNYVLALCGAYLFPAMTASGNGGSISPITGGSTSVPDPYEFTISNSSFIATGGSSASIPAFGGYNVLFIRNNIPQSTVDLGTGSYYSWDKNTQAFICTPAAFAGELFQLYPI